MNILITGETGYISGCIYEKLVDKKQTYNVVKKSIRNGLADIDLQGIDVIIHLAAMVHKNEANHLEEEYLKVNYKLTKKLATLAKKQGVKQFVFFSTMAVYGADMGEISSKTPLRPTTFYGKSKLLAEQELQKLASTDFKVAIIRPPMVYGPHCPGNYALLQKVSRIIPFFPKVENQRSMIFIGNLIEFIGQIIEHEDVGIFHPQDPQYINTTNMVYNIATVHKKRLFLTTIGAFLLKLLIGHKAIYRKVFGNLYYNSELSSYRDNSYQKFNVENAIIISEKEK